MTVVDGGSGAGEALAGRLRAHGITATAVADCQDVTEDDRRVVLLAGLRPVGAPAEGLEVQRAAFRAARRIAAGVAAEGGLLVAVQDTGGDFGLSGSGSAQAWLGGLAGLARTAAAEWPDAAVKAIDCAVGDRTAEQIADVLTAELLHGGSLLDVALAADGGRATPRPVAAAVEVSAEAEGAGPHRIGPDSVIVATGGGRGVTAAALVELARTHRPRLALLGRTALADEPAGLPAPADEPTLTRALADRAGGGARPGELAEQARRIMAVREIRATLAAIEQAGSPVRYLTADVTDPASLAEALDAVRAEWGPLTGLVHAAGTLADKRLPDKTDAHFDVVFDTKAEALRHLLELTAEDPLSVMCLFSSVAGAFGNAGQSDYAMANETLAHVASAEAARRSDCLVRSIAWGPWDGGMVSPSLAAHFTAAGVPLLAPADGARALVAELDSADLRAGRVVVTAAGAGGPAEALDPGRRPLGAQVRVTGDSHPHLGDHVIAGSAVLPMAQTLEWFTAAACGWRPGSDGVVLRDVRVLRKATLPRLAEEGHRFDISGRRDDSGDLVAELRGEGGQVHYRAVVASGPRPAQAVEARFDCEPWDRETLYDGDVLFHGPRFRSLASVEGVSAQGARGTVTGLASLGWPEGNWRTDPAAVDGAFQLAVLWAERLLGGATLPMAVGEFRVRPAVPGSGPMRCVVRAVAADPGLARCDLTLTAEDGATVAEIRDLELVVRPA
ncbi:SDR family oxidoreductase [Spirillospora sp. NPDC050679]